MAEYFTPEDSQKALANAATLDDVIEGEVGQQVTSPNGREFKTLATFDAMYQEVIDTAQEQVLSQGFVARVYDTPSDGVAAGTGVPNGKYFNARSSDPTIYADEYLNNNGIPQATGKTYPTLQAWTDALAAVTATGDAKIADVAATGEQKKAQLSEIAATVSGLNAGQEFFQTETALKATTPTVTGKVAKALDTKKVWYWNGSAWVDTGLSELDLAKNYADATFFEKSVNLTDQNLNTLLTSKLYTQGTAANATAANNYPSSAQANAGSGIVLALSAGVVIQVWWAAGITNTRITYDAGSAWTAWVSSLGINDYNTLAGLVTTLESKVTARLEWFISGSTGAVNYDKATKTLSWATPLIASYKGASNRRIQIVAGSVTFAGTGYEVLYLDTATLPATGTVDSGLLATCLKINSYSDASSVAFTDKINQIPLAKLNPQGQIEACAGFVKIKADAVQKDTFSYKKITDLLNLYLPASNGNIINLILRHDVKAFDGTSSNSQIDLWRIERALELNQALEQVQDIVTYGEWEFTMRESAYPADHVGGGHGDELLTSAYFLVDGVYKDAVSWTGTGEAKEIRLQLKSEIYRLNTNTVIADHYKELIITKDGVTANQSVTMRTALTLDRVWIAMLPTNRVASNSVQVTTKDIRDGVVRDVSAAGFTQVYTPLKNGSFVNVSGTKYSTSVTVSNIIGAQSNADIYVANADAYNKIYVSAIGGASSGASFAANDKISWTTKYRIDAVN